MVKTLIFLSLFATFQFCYATSLFSYGHELLKDDSSMLIDLFYNEHSRFVQTGEKSELLAHAYNKLKLPVDLRRKQLNDFTEEDSILFCLTCRTTVGGLMLYRTRDNKTAEEMQKIAENICIEMNVQTDEVCAETTKIMVGPLMFILDENPDLTAYDICAIVAQSEKCGTPRNPMYKFELEVSGEGPPLEGHKEASPDSGEYLKIVHFTDIHYDPRYIAGSKASCDEPICCQNVFSSDVPDEERAGFWGDYRDCDLPWRTVEASIKNIKQDHPDADMVYWTGDIVDHTVWDTSESGVIKWTDDVNKLYEKEFNYTKFYPVLGNHEAHPVNLFAPPELDNEFASRWLYDSTATAWSKWLPEEAIETVRNGGYYTVRVMDGFRLIVLNDNDAYTFNFWIFYSTDLIKRQLQWLHDTLLQAEADNEKVHILLHIPSGRWDMYKGWAEDYAKIVERFYHIITGQFSGHTHKNEFFIAYDRANAQHAISVNFNGGSVTPYSYVNPNYLVYYVDKKSFEVVDVDFYMFDLDEINKSSAAPAFTKLYSFKEQWNMEDMSPKSFNTIVERWSKDVNGELRKYWELKGKNGRPHIAQDCQDECLVEHLCTTVITNVNDDRKCKELAANSMLNKN